VTRVIGPEAGAVDFTGVPFGTKNTCYAVETPDFVDTTTGVQTLFTGHLNKAIGPLGDGKVKPVKAKK
jgi:hypothetical protein